MLDKIYSQLKASRNRALYLLETARSLALKDPTYSEIESTIRELEYQIGMEESNSVENIAKLSELKARRDARLKELKLDAPTPFSCNICKDTGFVGTNRCSCVTKRMKENILGNDFSDKLPTFRSAEYTVFGDKNKVVKSLYGKIYNYCKKFESTAIHNIILTGAVGSGKTYLTGCVADYLLRRDKDVQMLSAFSLNSIFLASHTAELSQKNAIIAPLLDCDLLIIDDLGTEPIYRNVTLEYLYIIVSERGKRGRHTTITTNLDLEALRARYGERIFTRLTDKSISYTILMPTVNLRSVKLPKS